MKHKHHIIPRYMGGGDEPSNIIEVTIEEHAELHLDLYLKYGNWQDWRAFNGLMGVKDEMYEAHSVAMMGSNNPMFGLRGDQHPGYGHGHTDRHREWSRKRMTHNNPNQDPAVRKKISDARSGVANKVWRYCITYQDGSSDIVTNLKDWCRQRGLGHTYLYALKNGRRTKPYKNITGVTRLHLKLDRPNP